MSKTNKKLLLLLLHFQIIKKHMVIIVNNSSHPPTVGQQITDRLPTGYQQITNSRQPEN